jgi:hypothetical protein
MRLTPLLRRLDIRWSRTGSAQLVADLERTKGTDAVQANPAFRKSHDGPGPLIRIEGTRIRRSARAARKPRRRGQKRQSLVG